MVAVSIPGVEAGLPAGTTLDVFTVAGYRGYGIARLLWPWATRFCVAEQKDWRPLHSPSRTRDGEKYAKSVGGEIPERPGGRYVECSKQFDPKDALGELASTSTSGRAGSRGNALRQRVAATPQARSLCSAEQRQPTGTKWTLKSAAIITLPQGSTCKASAPAKDLARRSCWPDTEMATRSCCLSRTPRSSSTSTTSAQPRIRTMPWRSGSTRASRARSGRSWARYARGRCRPRSQGGTRWPASSQCRWSAPSPFVTCSTTSTRTIGGCGTPPHASRR